MKTGGHIKEAVIEPVAFSQEMISVANGVKSPTSKYLLRLTEQIKNTRTKTVWFPIHINNSHWIAGWADLENHTFAFGEFFGMAGIN